MSALAEPIFSPAFENLTAVEVLEWGIEQFGDRLALSTSFQAAGMVLLDMAVRVTAGRIQAFTIDTGRLPEETHELRDEVRRRYGIEIEVVYPDSNEVAAMVEAHGRNLFYDSVAKRQLCCHIRKVRPLAVRLSSLRAWAVGLRRTQGPLRQAIRKVDIDSEHGGIVKLCPLADWSDKEVSEYIRRYDVPQHKLYTQGYTSIGCAPCTRATHGGEDPRAGRWWWEADDKKECGIHFASNGQSRRDLDVLLEEIVSVSDSRKSPTLLRPGHGFLTGADADTTRGRV